MPKIKKIYIYNDSHLPEDGWIQACFNCNTLTCQNILLQTFYKKENLYEFYIHTCGRCKKEFKSDDEKYIKFNDVSHAYIKENFNHLFTSGT